MDGEEGNPSIKEKFGISEVSGFTGAAAVDAAFRELSAFIKKGGLSAQPGVINLGDWIDLESLTVNAYGEGDDAGGFTAKNDPVTPDELPFDGYKGSWLRLIVVGINSFQPKDPYNVPENAGVDHVVFQFQNIQWVRRMAKAEYNTGGYALSEMREYLVGVDGKGGNYLKGLKTAGVPEDVLWAPVRYVANGYNDTPRGTNALTDLLWLPTEREMFGSQTRSFAVETEENQARLEYYTGDEYRIKFALSNQARTMAWYYWESSPYSGPSWDGVLSAFCVLGLNGGAAVGGLADAPMGVVPAFCVR